MRIHLIAIGGAAMHNIALDLKSAGHDVTGSDDEIYEPSLSRLKEAGILPDLFGWMPERINDKIDFIILGMHARGDNPELKKALEIKIPVYSYPEFIYRHSFEKKRVVIAGSHGKTTTTAMILHVLNSLGYKFDYLIGAQLDGFDKMVKITDAPIIIIEGDEYLSSPIDRIPKIHHYKPDIAVITGIAWDHMNVFPTFENYKEQFSIFIKTMEPDSSLVYFDQDKELSEIVSNSNHQRAIAYNSLKVTSDKKVLFDGKSYDISIIGNHNLQNMHAALLVCEKLGISGSRFMEAIINFKGASKRLQKLSSDEFRGIYLDFAHAPSKVKATTDAIKGWFGDRKLLAVLELHTYSSLNKEFIPQYKLSLQAAEKAVVFYNEHTLQMKKMPPLDETFIKDCFDHNGLIVFTDEKLLYNYIRNTKFKEYNILLMTSGNFNKMSLEY